MELVLSYDMRAPDFGAPARELYAAALDQVRDLGATEADALTPWEGPVTAQRRLVRQSAHGETVSARSAGAQREQRAPPSLRSQVGRSSGP